MKRLDINLCRKHHKTSMLVGVGNHIEIWSKEKYEASEESFDADAVALKLEELGLSL